MSNGAYFYGWLIFATLPAALLAATGIVLAWRYRSVACYLVALGFIAVLVSATFAAFVTLDVTHQYASTGTVIAHYGNVTTTVHGSGLVGALVGATALLWHALRSIA